MSNTSSTELTDADKELLRETIQRLLSRGAVFREDHRELYDWARTERARLDELGALIGLKLLWEQDSRLILAIPQTSRLLRRLKQDETLVALALWYDFDRAVKDERTTPDEVRLRVCEFNELLAAKFKSLKLPLETRLGEILRLLERKSLVRLESTSGTLADAVIHILPTIRYVIPFQAVEDWNRTRERYVAAAASLSNDTDTEHEPEDSTD